MAEPEWRWREFEALKPRELHDLLKLRCDTFVVEQRCAFPEIDGKDPEATHLLCLAGPALAGCLRVFGPDATEPAARIGRLAIAPDHRGTGLGHAMMREAIAFCEGRFLRVGIVLSAQSHLQAFYARHGFRPEGEPYLEDGIPHVDMRRSGA
jgi:ElaA protein